jgi:hypothetical protein
MWKPKAPKSKLILKNNPKGKKWDSNASADV